MRFSTFYKPTNQPTASCNSSFKRTLVRAFETGALLLTLMPFRANAVTVERLTGSQAAAYSKLGENEVKTTNNDDGSLTLEFRGNDGEIVKFTLAKEEFAKLLAKKGDKAAYNGYKKARFDEAYARLAAMRKEAERQTPAQTVPLAQSALIPAPVPSPSPAPQPAPQAAAGVAMIERPVTRPPPSRVEEPKSNNVAFDIGTIKRGEEPFTGTPIPYDDGAGNKGTISFRIAQTYFNARSAHELATEISDRVASEIRRKGIRDWNRSRVLDSLTRAFEHTKRDLETESRGGQTNESTLTFGESTDRAGSRGSIDYSIGNTNLRFKLVIKTKALYSAYAGDNREFDDTEKIRAVDAITAQFMGAVKAPIKEAMKHEPSRDDTARLEDAIRNFVQSSVDTLSKPQVIRIE